VDILLTAHSLPLRVLASGDPYESDFRAMADAVRRELVIRGLDDGRIGVAFQSQGMGGGEWLGPDLATRFAELHADGARQLLVAPIGFLADHVETLYDIDVHATALASSLGFHRLERMPAMNTRARFIDALEAVAREQLGPMG
jgi:ferrochelatase